ncbi:MAG: phosphate signaling complex protein PhoU [Pedosphaera sp.]|nr:phosphate signaling complex protein PhoU [Pedosphaera sp.]
MQRPFDIELAKFKESLLLMAGTAEDSVQNAMRALIERDDDLANRVKADDDLLDRLEMEVDEEAINLLSMAPLATDLRAVAVGMKISHELERVGDEATSIAKSVLELNREPQLKESVDIPRMARLATALLRSALDAFVHQRPDQARLIIPDDDEVDQLHKQLNRELTQLMEYDKANIRRCLNLIVVVKRLERVADHATNIAEEVVYLYEATDIRHADHAP